MGVLRQKQHLGALTSAEQTVLPFVMAASMRYGVDPALILGIISAESSFRNIPSTLEEASFGYMQVNIHTARDLTGNADLAPDDLLDPATNIDLGTRYLRQQIDRYGGDDVSAISAYNAGSATSANQGYVAKVLSERDRFRVELGDLPGADVSLTITATAPPGPFQPFPPPFTLPTWLLYAGGGLIGLVLLIAVVRRG